MITIKSTGKYNITNDSKGGQTTKSRKIVEDLLNIELPDYMVVHHIDMDRSNNDIDNLMLMSREDHSSFHASLRRDIDIECTCNNCNKIFYLKPSKYRSRKKISPYLYCCHSCAGQATARLGKLTQKLNRDDIITIYLSKENYNILSEKYHVHKETIRSIKQERSHKGIIESFKSDKRKVYK